MPGGAASYRPTPLPFVAAQLETERSRTGLSSRTGHPAANPQRAFSGPCSSTWAFASGSRWMLAWLEPWLVERALEHDERAGAAGHDLPAAAAGARIVPVLPSARWSGWSGSMSELAYAGNVSAFGASCSRDRRVRRQLDALMLPVAGMNHYASPATAGWCRRLRSSNPAAITTAPR